ncbi:MetQ/NlpA family ABC transporter substrate-binding protein [Nesterenkonia muleiensis]|uniref:MetQ/NlpA family ABC transporter substrate-binding protein n=1 Tax=Nesterenkonia muleiensis TaxID=2282648 RepID=UPI000E72E3A5|nr:MetQ/NlpA family ABC transporter substrate-binding protein [Nesterenkonia muleiensis]
MNARRRLLASTAILSASALALTACGLVGGGDSDDDTITLIVTESAAFQDPTEIVQELLEEEGWNVEATYVDDWVRPNHAVSDGEFDANYFQHLVYLNQFNQDNDLDLEPMFAVHVAPSGIFSAEYDSLDELPDGAEIALPVDPGNNWRGIRLLANEGLIEIDPEVPYTQLSQDSITENPQNFSFVEMEAQQIPQSMSSVDAGWLLVRLAAENDIDINSALVLEEDELALPITIVVAAPAEFRGTDKAEALERAYQSPEVQEWYDDYLGGVMETSFDVDIDGAWEDVTSEGFATD